VTEESTVCRVTVMAPSGRMDVGLPVEVPLLDLLPALLAHAGSAMDGIGPAWALQKFGGEALDPTASPGHLGLRDGEVLYLRRHGDELPVLVFDDVADAIAATVRTLPRWGVKETRFAGLAAAATALGTVALVLAVGSFSDSVTGSLAALISTMLLVTATTTARVYADARSGAVFGVAAVAFAGVAGAVTTSAISGSAPGSGNAFVSAMGDSAGELGFWAAVLVVAAAAASALSVAVPGFVAIVSVAALAAGGALFSVVPGVDVAGSASMTAVVALSLIRWVPAIALRAAGVPRPEIPASAEDLRGDETEVSGADMEPRTRLADRLVTALLSALATVVVGAAVVLAVSYQPWVGPVLLTVIAAAIGMRARAFAGRAQRAFLLASAVICLLVMSVKLGASDHGTAYLGVGLPLVLAGLGLAIGVQAPRKSPVRRRIADIAEGGILVSLVPLTTAVLGLYDHIRITLGS
jgi:type VII secretion integral membrane protein EccD